MDDIRKQGMMIRCKDIKSNVFTGINVTIFSSGYLWNL